MSPESRGSHAITLADQVEDVPHVLRCEREMTRTGFKHNGTNMCLVAKCGVMNDALSISESCVEPSHFVFCFLNIFGFALALLFPKNSHSSGTSFIVPSSPLT